MLKNKLILAVPAVALLVATTPMDANARTEDIVKYGAIGVGALALGSMVQQNGYNSGYNAGYNNAYYGGGYYSQPYYGGYYSQPSYNYSQSYYSQPSYSGYYSSYPSYGYSGYYGGYGY